MSKYLEQLLNRSPKISGQTGEEYYYQEVSKLSNNEANGMLRHINFLEYHQKEIEKERNTPKKKVPYGKRVSASKFQLTDTDHIDRIRERYTKIYAQKDLSVRVKTLLGYEFAAKELNSLTMYTLKHLPENVLVEWEGYTANLFNYNVISSLVERNTLSTDLVRNVIQRDKDVYYNIYGFGLPLGKDKKRDLTFRLVVLLECLDRIEQEAAKHTYSYPEILEEVNKLIKPLLASYRRQNNLTKIPKEWVVEIIKTSY